MSFNNKFPLADGIICDTDIIIPVCPICGASHTHGHVHGEDIGSYTTRCPHCTDSKNHTIYIINIIKKVDLKQRYKIMRRFEKPRTTMPVPELLTLNEAKRRVLND